MSLVFDDGEWQVPDQFNFARDVVEAVALHDLTWPALTFIDSIGAIRRFTFTELNVLATRWSGLLRDHGIEAGDRILVLAGKKPDWHVVLLASMRCGAVSVPCHLAISGTELAHRADQCGASILVADRAAQQSVDEAFALLEDPPTLIYIDDLGVRLNDYPQIAPCEETRTDDIAFIVYTSGTEGSPKAVAHTHASTLAARMQAEYWLDARPDDLVWSTAETGWAESIWTSFLRPWSCGAEIFLHESLFDPRERLELIERLGVTVLCQAPTEYREMTKLEDTEHHDLSLLQHVVSTGEPLDPVVITSFHHAFGLTIHDGYGQSENTLLIANAPGSEIRVGSIGRPVPGHEVAIVDEDGRPVAAGVEGDIAVRGRPPSLFAGYVDAPDEATGRLRDEWYVTGDRGTHDRDGYFWLTGRAEDTIVSSGFQFGPFEIESALLQHEAVAEAAVVGKPDPEHGQVVKAFVVLQPGSTAEPNLADEIDAHCRLVTPPHQHPGEIELVDSLPKTANGKIRRFDLRQLEADRARALGRAATSPSPRKKRPVELLGSPEQPDAALQDGERVAVTERKSEESALVSRLHAYERGDQEERGDPRTFVVPSPPLDFSKARAARAKRNPPPKPEETAFEADAPPTVEAPPAE